MSVASEFSREQSGISGSCNLSARIADLQPSPIREILAVIGRPGMVSFAGGLPSPDSFAPLAAEMPANYLQYGPTEGEWPLREMVATRLQALGIRCMPEQVLILSGSQQGIDLVAKLFIDRGTSVAVESPTYLAALQVFRLFGARLSAFEPESAQSTWRDHSPTLAYAIPTFQNPTGHCYSSAQRTALAAACDAHNVVLFEDDPYRDLVYDTCDRTPVCALVKQAPWIYQGSFSKTLAPGLRLGFLAAAPALMPYLVRLKQAADLHSCRVSQYQVLQRLQAADEAGRLLRLTERYRDKRDRFAAQLQRHFADLADWQIPAGGLFFWLQLQRRFDTRRLLPRAIEAGVAFMPGEAFYPLENTGLGTLRLNFSHADEAAAEDGLRKLAELIRTTPSSGAD